MINVKIGKFPGKVEDYVLREGTTIKEALRLAGYDEVPMGYEVKFNEETVGLDEVLQSDGRLFLMENIKGA